MTNNQYMTKLMKSHNPAIQKYLQLSGIVSKKVVLHSLKRFLKLDRNSIEESRRDERLIKKVNGVHGRYIVSTPNGYRPINQFDIPRIKAGVNKLYHQQLDKLHELVRDTLDPMEIEKLQGLLDENELGVISAKLGISDK